MAEAGLHPATGGDGLSLCSGDMLLEALVACAGVTLAALSTSAPRPSGPRATSTSVAPSAWPRRLDLDTDATEDSVAELLELTER